MRDRYGEGAARGITSLAQIALLLCLVFILGALKDDFKECHGVSPSLWVPFIWLAVCASRPFTYWIHPGSVQAWAPDFDYLQGSSTERTFLIVLMSAGLIILYRKRGQFAFSFRDNIWLYLFYLYAIISVSWADYQGVSAKRWIRATGDIIMALVILTEDDQKEAVEHILRRCAIFMIPLSVLFIRYYRNLGIVFHRSGTPLWVGVTTNKNTLGLLCAFMGIFLIWRLLKNRPKLNVWDACLLGLTVYLLIGARSATSTVVFAVGLLILFFETFLKDNPKRFNVLIVTSVCLLFVLQGLFISVRNESVSTVFFRATGRDSTFTGRIPLWQELMRIGSHRPLLGSGYGSFWLGHLTHNLWDTFGWRPTNGHNGYLDVFMDLGLAGLVLMIFLIFHTYTKTRNSVEENWGIGKLQLAFLIMILFHNITETSLALPTNLLWFLFLLSALAVKKPADVLAPSQAALPAINEG